MQHMRVFGLLEEKITSHCIAQWNTVEISTPYSNGKKMVNSCLMLTGKEPKARAEVFHIRWLSREVNRQLLKPSCLSMQSLSTLLNGNTLFHLKTIHQSGTVSNLFLIILWAIGYVFLQHLLKSSSVINPLLFLFWFMINHSWFGQLLPNNIR